MIINILIATRQRLDMFTGGRVICKFCL